MKRGMDENGWVIFTFVVAGLFFLNGLACLYECLRNFIASRSLYSPASDNSSGWEFRKWFHILLLFANLARAVSLTLIAAFRMEDMLDSSDKEAKPGWDVWVVTLHTLPSMIFYSSYSLLILFWAHLYHEMTAYESASKQPLLKLLFTGLNVLLYVVFLLLVCIVAPIPSAYQKMWWMSKAVLGVFYCLGSFGFAYYGIRLVVQLYSMKLPSTAHISSALRRRVVAIGGLSFTLFFVRGLYALSVGVLHWRFYPEGKSHYEWDSIFHLVIEWGPSLMVLWFTRLQYGGSSVAMEDAYDEYNLYEDPYAEIKRAQDDNITGHVLLGSFTSSPAMPAQAGQTSG